MLVILPSPHPGTLACPCTPKVLQARGHALTPYSPIVFISDSHLNLSKNLEACHMVFELWLNFDGTEEDL
jgi:hypothetical protein